MTGPGFAVVEGTLVRGTTVVPHDTELRVGVPLRATTQAKLVAIGMSVVVAASSEIQRRAVERELLLVRGSVDVTSDGSRVVTSAFTVEVRGEANVSTRRVSVRKGTARVVASDDRVLASQLAAPRTWDAPEPPKTAKVNASELLEQARGAFNARDFATAERRADAALDATPTRTQAAEARMLLAECAQATGRLADALARYEAIATRFGDLPAAETALFAAARLESTRDRQSARALFERYLERYPSGRFADDARRELRAR